MAGTSEGAKKAARTRKRKGGQSISNNSRGEAGRKATQTRGHESLSQAGRKGGQHSHDND